MIFDLYTASEIHVRIRIVKTLAIILLTSIDLPYVSKILQSHPKLLVKMCPSNEGVNTTYTLQAWKTLLKTPLIISEAFENSHVGRAKCFRVEAL